MFRPSFLFVSLLLPLIGCHSEPSSPPVDASTTSAQNPGQVMIFGSSTALPSHSEYRQQPQSQDSLVIGLDADMTSSSAASGKAIQRGCELAIQEINESGGVLGGRKLELVIRDHHGNPDRGYDNILEFAAMDRTLAVVGGMHTPVAIRELPAIHENGMIYLDPWAAGTPIVANNFHPNFVFRVSVRDEYAGGFLVTEAHKRNFFKIGVLLERTGWGRSNEKAITEAMRLAGAAEPTIQWLNWGEQNLDRQIDSLIAGNCDCILLVANPLEGFAAISEMASRPREKQVPIISHWGITGSDLAKHHLLELAEIDLTFLQTFSFLNPRKPDRASQLVAAYLAKYSDCHSVHDIYAPVGTAHAYEIVKMFAAAVNKAGSTDRAKIRDAMESLKDVDGLIRDYQHPFPPEHHDALSVEDYFLARYNERGEIVPAEQ